MKQKSRPHDYRDRRSKDFGVHSEKFKPKPSQRQSKYKPAFCKTLIAVGCEGGSKSAMANRLGITRKTLGKWAKQHAEFGDALEFAVQLSQEYWENRWSRVMDWTNGNNAYRHLMATRFRHDYAERIQVAGDKEAPLVTKITRTIVKAKN